MNCEIYRDAIEDFLEGELDRQTAARLNAHVFACADCADAAQTIKNEKKEIYAHYLFDAEPPNDCGRSFRQSWRTRNTRREPCRLKACHSGKRIRSV